MKKILVTDDNAEIGDFIQSILEDEGYQVVRAVNGKECLTKVASEKPDMLITDVMMPEKTGYHALQDIRQVNKTMPVLVISGSTNVEHLFEDYDIEGFLKKPFKSDELLAKIKEILKD